MADKKNKQETKWKNAVLRVHCKNETQTGLIEYTTKDIIDILEDWCKTKKGIRYFFILHDKDIITKEDLEKEDYYKSFPKDSIGTLKAPHFHIVIVFDSTNGVDKKTILSKFPYGSCQKARDKYGDVTRAVQYLIHKNHRDKYQYDSEDIITNDPIELSRYLSVDFSQRLSKDSVIINLQNGLLRLYQIYDKNIVDDLTLHKYEKHFINAADIFYERYRLDYIEKSSTKLFILQGESRSGKTTYAFARSIENGLKLAKSSGSNDYMQHYKGQEAFLLDEFDESAVLIKNLLSFVDPNHAGDLPRRFRNLVFVGKYIFITLNDNWEDVYTKNKKVTAEQIHALHSRVDRLYKFKKTSQPFVSTVDEYQYNQILRKYELKKSHPEWDYKKYIPGALSTGVIRLEDLKKEIDNDLFSDSITQENQEKIQNAVDFIDSLSRFEEEAYNNINTVFDIEPKSKKE